jgi:hypothetical protein
LINGLLCTTCHTDFETFGRYEVTEVEFPSGAMLSLDDPDSNMCLLCHQGRESTVSVNGRIGEAEDDAVVEGLGFANVHYFAAGATLFGSDAQGAYQYDGKEYVGQFAHVEPFNTCIECHTAHELEVQYESCANCHPGVASVADSRNIRIDGTDWDGDGDTAEGVFGEVDTLRDMLYEAIQAYGADTAGTAIAYDSVGYPYFFADTNTDGVANPDEINFGNRYQTWTPRLLRAAYNYQYSQKDPGNYAHNGKYILQILYDSLEDVGVDVSGMTRP